MAALTIWRAAGCIAILRLDCPAGRTVRQARRAWAATAPLLRRQAPSGLSCRLNAFSLWPDLPTDRPVCLSFAPCCNRGDELHILGRRLLPGRSFQTSYALECGACFDIGRLAGGRFGNCCRFFCSAFASIRSIALARQISAGPSMSTFASIALCEAGRADRVCHIARHCLPNPRG